jgi:hypothetical protein
VGAELIGRHRHVGGAEIHRAVVHLINPGPRSHRLLTDHARHPILRGKTSRVRLKDLSGCCLAGKSSLKKRDVYARGRSTVFITVRKFRLIRSEVEVREAVMAGLIPILKASPGFQSHWVIACTDGDFAGISVFDSESNATAAQERTLEWVNAHIREYVVLPPDAMFGGEAYQLV